MQENWGNFLYNGVYRKEIGYHKDKTFVLFHGKKYEIYKTRHNSSYIWGTILTENVCQCKVCDKLHIRLED